MGRHNKLRFVMLIGGSITIALFLVSVSITMYFSSGTAQVDLSRPGYQSVRDQTMPEDPYKGFPSSGVVEDKTLNDFNKLYQERAKEATTVDAFNSDVLSDSALNIADSTDDAE
ncbi:hypothetical protein HY312_00740 [Candidatus Saccharibacteria bacterium]|nr:hypothetical protein [Candidatus Saccharibacteria bacterium]